MTHNTLVAQLRPLIHPMLVHFPIALLFASVALDWIGYWLKHPNLTRAGFYTLVLSAFAAGIAALSGPDHATGDSSVPALLAAHQTWASMTVALAVAMVAARFLTTRGLRGGWALLYLVSTLALLVAVSLTGYFGGEMTYHHAIGVTVNNAPVAGALGLGGDASAVRPLIPAKPFVALVGFLAVVGFCLWLTLGRRLAPGYYSTWWRAVRQELANSGAPLWTLQRGDRHTTPMQSSIQPPVPLWHASQHASQHASHQALHQAAPYGPTAQQAQSEQTRRTARDPNATDDDSLRLRWPHP